MLKKNPDLCNLVKRTDHDTNISEIENKIRTDYDDNKYITTEEFNKLKAESFTARLAQAKLASKSGIANFVKKDKL